MNTIQKLKKEILKGKKPQFTTCYNCGVQIIYGLYNCDNCEKNPADKKKALINFIAEQKKQFQIINNMTKPTQKLESSNFYDYTESWMHEKAQPKKVSFFTKFHNKLIITSGNKVTGILFLYFLAALFIAGVILIASGIAEAVNK